MIDHFFQVLDDLGYTVEYCDLSSKDRLGETVPSKKLVRLHNDLTDRERVFVLGHETWHAINGDEPTMFGFFDERMEKQADEWSAMTCIDLAHFFELEAQYSGHVPTMAYHLNVPDEAVEIYRTLLSRIGDKVFLGARMGEGQWMQKVDAA